MHTDGAPSYQPSGSQLGVVSEVSSRWFALDAGMAKRSEGADRPRRRGLSMINSRTQSERSVVVVDVVLVVVVAVADEGARGSARGG